MLARLSAEADSDWTHTKLELVLLIECNWLNQSNECSISALATTDFLVPRLLCLIRQTISGIRY